MLLASSDPASPKYGRHHSNEQLGALLAPPPATVSAVSAWMTSETGLNQSSVHVVGNGDFVQVEVSVAQA